MAKPTKIARRGMPDPTWRRIFHNTNADVYESMAYDDYYMAKFDNDTKLFFYGETAFQDYQRYVYDYTVQKTFEKA